MCVCLSLAGSTFMFYQRLACNGNIWWATRRCEKKRMKWYDSHAARCWHQQIAMFTSTLNLIICFGCANDRSKRTPKSTKTKYVAIIFSGSSSRPITFVYRFLSLVCSSISNRWFGAMSCSFLFCFCVSRLRHASRISAQQTQRKIRIQNKSH